MSGPIVRKYGFPNHEKIFGKREIQHGVDATSKPAKDETPGSQAPTPAQEPPAAPKRDAAW